MICPKCGREIPDGAVCSCSMGAPALSSNPALNAIKTIGSSPLFLVAAILYSVSILCSLIAGMNSGDTMSYLYYFFADLDVDPSFLYPYMSAAERSSAVVAILAAVPTILIAVGMWMHYATCRNTQSGNISTAGLTMCKVLLIINLVCVCIAAAVVIVGFILIIAGLGSVSSYYDYGYTVDMAGLMVVFVILMILLAVVLTLGIIYAVSAIKSINRIKGTAASGVPNNRIPQYLIVMNYIMGVLSAISGFASLFMSPLSGLSTLASAVCMILVAICLSKYRQQMTILMYPPVQPVYASQPMQGGYAQPVQQPSQPAAPAVPQQPAVPVAPTVPQQSAGQPGDEKPEQ